MLNADVFTHDRVRLFGAEFHLKFFGTDKNIVKNTRKTSWHTVHINCHRHTVVVAQRTISVANIFRVLLYRQISRRKVEIFTVFVFKLNSALMTMGDYEHFPAFGKVNVTSLHMHIIIHKLNARKYRIDCDFTIARVVL